VSARQRAEDVNRSRPCANASSVREDHPSQRRRASIPSMHPWSVAVRERRCSARPHSRLPPLTAESIVHAPFAVELSNGCSVGCGCAGSRRPGSVIVFTHGAEHAELSAACWMPSTGVRDGHRSRSFVTGPPSQIDNHGTTSDSSTISSPTKGSSPDHDGAGLQRPSSRTRAIVERSVAASGMINRV